MGEDPLFKRQSINERIRAVMRTEFGWSHEKVASIRERDLDRAMKDEVEKRQLCDKHIAKAPDWIEAGYVTEEEFDAMNRAELRDFAKKAQALEVHDAVERGEDYYISMSRASSLTPRKPANDTKTTPDKSKDKDKDKPMPMTIDTLSRDQQLTLHADMLAVIAAQQAQIDQLRQEVASLKNSNLAVFGHHQVIDQLTSVPRDFEGVEVHMTLEEQITESEEGARSASETGTGSVKDARDAAAGIEGLASLIAGLNIKRTVNLDTLNEVSRKMSERSKSLMKTRSKGEVHVKFAKVTGGTAALAAGSGAIREVGALAQRSDGVPAPSPVVPPVEDDTDPSNP